MIWCDVPEEVLLEEIFSWLPPESLFRFKCVSKSWYALINSLIKNPEFVNKHLRNIENNILSPYTCLVFCCATTAYTRRRRRQPPPPQQRKPLRRRDLLRSLTLFHNRGGYGSDDPNYVSEVFRLPTLPSKLNFARASGSHINGIICLAHDETIVLCNPALNEWTPLPKPCLDDGNGGGFWVRRVGFGYDSRADDYKVVRLGYEGFGRNEIEYYRARAEVYSMRRDCWREVEFDGLELVCRPLIGKEVFCKGVFYWSICARENIILSFDVFDEVFRWIPLPNNLLVTEEEVKLTVWNDSVALFVYHAIEIPKLIQVWLMDDCSAGGVNDSRSWIKKLCIGPLLDIDEPLTFLKNDELLLKTKDEGLILFNVCSQMLRNLTIIRSLNTILFWEISYVKSLVSVAVGTQSRS
ncbi:F-box domain containing protein [Parasponia andersonii]|uniref:F-box domain containing protein n=1 Tax=Parasponia andersonii TaxID=3476 RepID=A0A2P5DB25_PARAD|nr:F-box domain containing protein [Parasponia andersonii]